jgi:hypothetical protein
MVILTLWILTTLKRILEEAQLVYWVCREGRKEKKLKIMTWSKGGFFAAETLQAILGRHLLS